MSDIVRARELIDAAIADLRAARSLMTRQPPIKRSKPKRVVITPHMRRRVRKLASTKLSNHAIADMVGLPNAGRVSEILSGKR